MKQRFDSRWSRPRSFPAASQEEHENAELFFAEMLGESEALEDVPQPAPVPAPAPAPAPTPSVYARSVAVTDNLALLVTDHAPLPVTASEVQRVATNAGARDDYKSVCAFVPDTPHRSLLVFFHGNNNYVTVAPAGDVPARVDPSQHSRVPLWTDAAGRASASAKKAAPLQYRLDSLARSQGRLSLPVSLPGVAIKNPVVLVPEDAERRSTGNYWSVPPRGQYGSSDNGTPTGPGTTRLQELIIDCYEQLRCLPNTSARPYLSRQMLSGSWVGNLLRTYVAGHSGGGKPLVETAGADAMLVTSTSAMGVRGRAADLWLLDCTYGFGVHNYVNFCRNWRNANLLAYRSDSSRLVCVYRPASHESDTETEADSLRRQIATDLQVDAGTLRKLHDSSDMSSRTMVNDVLPALTSSAVIFIRTNVAHDDIPTLFIPLLLRTAAS